MKKKYLLYLSFVVSVFLILSFFNQLPILFISNAASVTTSVTVGNSPPSFTTSPYEDPASTVTAPTKVGSDVTFKATANDSNNENYYLIVCSTDSVTPHNGTAPTCGGTMYCISSSTASTSPASCAFTTLASTPQSNSWYAFVCDANSGNALCSLSSQGTGDSGSPFVVNHLPTFTAVSTSDTSVDPGGAVTWSATANDPDADTVKLLVCKTSTITEGGECTGGASNTLCSSSLVASNPSCTYDVPAVAPDGSVTAYAFIVDSFNAPASGGSQGSDVSFTINNVAPVISSVTLNSGNAITLVEGSTTEIAMTATVTDNNGCSNGEIASVVAYVYRSGTAYTGCNASASANSNYCYPEVSCTQVANSCVDATDASANYSCTVDIQYFADPTDADTVFPLESWLNTFKATDNNSLTATGELTTGVELNSLIGMTAPEAIAYGNLGAGQKNDPLDKTTKLVSTGNVGLDTELSGTDMCIDYPTCASSPNTPIAVGNQKHALVVDTAYATGVGLTSSPVAASINIPKCTSIAENAKNIWWGLSIPIGTISGTYTGSNTITAFKSPVAVW